MQLRVRKSTHILTQEHSFHVTKARHPMAKGSSSAVPQGKRLGAAGHTYLPCQLPVSKRPSRKAEEEKGEERILFIHTESTPKTVYAG